MDPHKQSTAAQLMFDPNVAALTCIDCHKGIAHRLPKEEASKPSASSEQLPTDQRTDASAIPARQ